MKGDSGLDDMKTSLSTLYSVLLTTAQMMSCFTPFISDMMYLNLRNGLPDGHELKADSIHFL